MGNALNVLLKERYTNYTKRTTPPKRGKYIKCIVKSSLIRHELQARGSGGKKLHNAKFKKMKKWNHH